MRTLLVALSPLILLGAGTAVSSRIAFVRVAAAAGEPQIFIAAADGSDEHPLPGISDTDGSASYDAVWAPDGKSIVFTSERDGSADLYRVNPDGSGLKRLTTDPAYDDQAAFSPDGERLAFVSTREGGVANLWTLDLGTLRAKRLTSAAGGDFRPAWSPDGRWIAFASGRGKTPPFAEGRWERLQPAEIYIIHPDGSGLKKVTASDNFCGSPKWMADSRRVVTYCMTAQQTLPNRVTKPVYGRDSGGTGAG